MCAQVWLLSGTAAPCQGGAGGEGEGLSLPPQASLETYLCLLAVVVAMGGEEQLLIGKGHRYEMGKQKLGASPPSFGAQSQWVEMVWLGIWTPGCELKVGALMSQIAADGKQSSMGR